MQLQVSFSKRRSSKALKLLLPTSSTLTFKQKFNCEMLLTKWNSTGFYVSRFQVEEKYEMLLRCLSTCLG